MPTFTITDLGSKGEGVGKHEGLILFVEKALPGDVIEAEITKLTPRYGFAKLKRIETPSPDRIEAPCPLVSTCGSCQIQSLAYSAQLRWKEQKVRSAFARIAHLPDASIEPILGMETPFYYRNKAQFPACWVNKKLALGFYKVGSHDIVDVPTCAVQHPAMNLVLSRLRDYFALHPVSVYSEKEHKGLLRHVVMRVSILTGKVLLCLVINGRKFPSIDFLVSWVKASNVLEGVVINIHTQRNNVIMGHECQLVWGKDHLIDTIGTLQFRISPLSFFQVNPTQTKVLYDQVLEAAALTGKETVLDMFSGIGTIALYLASHALKVVGLEEVSQAVEDATFNAALNKCQNVEFLCGDAEIRLKQYTDEGKKADVVVLDPPRKGCEKALLHDIVALAPSRIIYVSCDPATLARDSVELIAGGYQLKTCKLVDLFPHTIHVESVALFIK